MSSLPSVYQEVIAMSRYARYIPEKNRRETWEETVTRLTNYLKTKVNLIEDETSKSKQTRPNSQSQTN